MARECKCKINIEEICRYSSDGKLVPEYTMIYFEKGKIYYFYNKGNTFYFSDEKKCLKDMNRYSDRIEIMEKVEFDEYFEYEIMYNTKDEGTICRDIYSNNLKRYNDVIEKFNPNDLFDNGLTDVELIKFKQAERMLGLGDLCYEFDYKSKKERKNKLKLYKKTK